MADATLREISQAPRATRQVFPSSVLNRNEREVPNVSENPIKKLNDVRCGRHSRPIRVLVLIFDTRRKTKKTRDRSTVLAGTLRRKRKGRSMFPASHITDAHNRNGRSRHVMSSNLHHISESAPPRAVVYALLLEVVETER